MERAKKEKEEDCCSKGGHIRNKIIGVYKGVKEVIEIARAENYFKGRDEDK